MVEYICEICNKKFTRLSNYKQHQARKNPCIKNSPKLSQNSHKLSLNIKKLQDSNPEDLICNFCKKQFSNKYNLKRHLETNKCKVKKEQDNEKEVIFTELVSRLKKIEKQNKELKQEVKAVKNINKGQIGNNNTMNNTTNNIKIVAFGKEDLSYISNGEWLKLLKNNYKAIEKLTQITHFNQNKPENQNIYISNLRSKYIMVHDGEEWVVKDRKNTVDDLYDEKAYIIFNKVDELNETLPIRIVDKFNEIKDKYDEDKIRNALIRDLDMTLYNQRKIPIMSHKIKE